MAGDSAREVARRMREKSERLARAAEMWERGADGEDETARVLATLPAEFVVRHDLRWPGRQRANIDHVVVGPTGVFVIDSKNWSGSVTVRDGVLRQNGYSRETTVAGAAEAALAVARVMSPLPVSLVVPVLCLVRDEEVAGSARDVTLASTTTLVRTITERPLVLGPSAHHAALRALDRSQGVPVPPLVPARARPAGRRRPPALLRGLLAIAVAVVAALVVLDVVRGAVPDAPAAAPPPRAQGAGDASTWIGTYRCSDVVRAARLDVWTRPDGQVAGDFRFGSAAERSATGPGGRYRLLGQPRDGVLVLEPTTWVQQPDGFSMVGLQAGAPVDGVLRGRVLDPSCTTFRLRRR